MSIIDADLSGDSCRKNNKFTMVLRLRSGTGEHGEKHGETTTGSCKLFCFAMALHDLHVSMLNLLFIAWNGTIV
jgi:hypothetical protein